MQRTGISIRPYVTLWSSNNFAHRRLPGAPASASVRCYCNGIAEIRLDGAVTRVENVAPGSYRMEVLDGAGKVEQAHPVVVIEGQTTSVDATK